MAAKSREIDRGWLRIKRNLRRGPEPWAKVGVQGDKAQEAREDGITNVELASTHEYGSPDANVPQRSFIRSTFDEKVGGYKRELDRLGRVALEPAKLRGELRLLGEKYREDIIEKIRSSIPPPLSPLTIARKKGETTALIDTGQLLRSIDVAVSWEAV